MVTENTKKRLTSTRIKIYFGEINQSNHQMIKDWFCIYFKVIFDINLEESLKDIISSSMYDRSRFNYIAES